MPKLPVVATGWNWFFYIRECEISCIHNLQFRLEQLTDQTKKAKKYQLVGIALSINDNAKSPQT